MTPPRSTPPLDAARPPVPRRTLAPGYEISRIIKGGWQLSRGHLIGEAVDRDAAIADTLLFIRSGITTLDVGDIYIGVEELIGDCLRRVERELGAGARRRVQLHTKYVPDLHALPAHSSADVERGVDRSRQRLGVDTLDLVQLHWWDYAVPGYVDALLSLQRLRQEGKIRLLGVTNFDVPRLREFVAAGVTPATIQVQYSVLDHRPETGMFAFCEQHGIAMLCYGTVAGGFLSERYLGAPEPQPPYKNRSLTKYKLIIDDAGGWGLFQELLRALKNVADSHGVSIAAVASAYVLRQPPVGAVIVGAHDRSHLAANLQIGAVRLQEHDVQRIEAVASRAAGPRGEVYGLERNDPKHAGIMHTANNREAAAG
jgi:aryl-alcohol dehydrogenase-like predicted oxidoreductase